MNNSILLLFPILLFSCGTKHSNTVAKNASKPILISDSTEVEKIEVRVGETFEIALGSVPGTGYSWQLRKPIDPKMLDLVSQQFVSGKDEEGLPGKDVFTFKAKKSGKTEVLLWYIRPWLTNNEVNPEVVTNRYLVNIP